tara:strand:+ start:1324 stop:1512 length:189 start_codon:yes stop_codon:yes gene_type:complete
MKFLFREEEAKPEHWKMKEDIVKAYFELCKVQFREPFFKADRPISKADFGLAVWELEEVGVL